MNQEEMQEFKNRQLAAEKLFREGSEFLNKFKEQQESFKTQSQQQGRRVRPTGVDNKLNRRHFSSSPVWSRMSLRELITKPTEYSGRQHRKQMQSGQTPTPAPHTINSAVNAARNQAGQAAMSPSDMQPGQTSGISIRREPTPVPIQCTSNPSSSSTVRNRITTPARNTRRPNNFQSDPQPGRLHTNPTPTAPPPGEYPRPSTSPVTSSRDRTSGPELHQ